MSVGLRVVRGPDWNLGNKDKGEGHVGTVVRDNGDDTYGVVWDMGEKTTCRGGKGGKSDLIVLDNAPAGAKHLSVKCDECGKNTIIGIRWKCKTCDDTDLCSPCYLTDRHDLSHPFMRIDKPQARSVDVPKRSNSTKIKAYGIFPGAVVVRGQDWEYGTQDGGSGKKGKVEDLRNFGSDVGGRNAVRVRWETSGEANVYRVGSKGKVDLMCVSEGQGGAYYRDHLPVLGKASTPSSSGATSGAGATSGDTIIQVGDKCVVDMPEEALKEVQRGHGGWSVRMSECIGEICTVKQFVGDSIIEVQYKDKSYQFYAGAVSKVFPVSVGDVVRVSKDEKKCILLQRNHGGWNDDMKQALGLVGKVVKIDSDGDVAVAFGNNAWVYNPALLTPAPGAKPDSISGEVDFSKSTSEDPRAELGDGLARLMAHMLLLETLGRRQLGPEQMVALAGKGDLNGVRTCVKQDKDLVNCIFKDVTPLIIAAHEGHEDVVTFLLQNGANIDAKTSKGSTALLAALAGKEEKIAMILVQNKANVNVCDQNQRSPSHMAAFENMGSALKMILEKGGNPNKQDVEGDTPIHDAIYKCHDRCVALLLSHPRLDLTLSNKKGFNPLIWAALKGHELAVERIIGKAPHLVNQSKEDKHTALHVAAINDHQEIANILIMKGKAEVDARNNQNLTALHLAAYEGYADMVKILVLHGADFKLKDDDGDTALHCAMRIKRPEADTLLLQMFGLSGNSRQKENEKFKIACFLLEKGASYQATNNQGATPLQVCPSARLKNAVVEVIKKSQMTPHQAAANAFGELLTELMPMPCAVCKDNISNARFLPCKHRVTCVNCCFRVNRCPLCESPVAERIDQHGRKLIVDPCRVQ